VRVSVRECVSVFVEKGEPHTGDHSTAGRLSPRHGVVKKGEPLTFNGSLSLQRLSLT
jgi:hypothetical protein